MTRYCGCIYRDGVTFYFIDNQYFFGYVTEILMIEALCLFQLATLKMEPVDFGLQISCS